MVSFIPSGINEEGLQLTVDSRLWTGDSLHFTFTITFGYRKKQYFETQQNQRN